MINPSSYYILFVTNSFCPLLEQFLTNKTFLVHIHNNFFRFLGRSALRLWYLGLKKTSLQSQVIIKVSNTWCVFVRASLHMRREEKPTRCRWKIYCTYNMLNMFRTLQCPSSGARDYMFVITASGVRCLAAGCWGSDAGQQAVRPERGMLHSVASSWFFFSTHMQRRTDNTHRVYKVYMSVSVTFSLSQAC